MAAINSTGFDPDIHVAESPPMVAAKVRSRNCPGMVLSLTDKGVTWAEGLMAQRPYFKENWTIERMH